MDQEGAVARKVLVSGRVQGVGFRVATVEAARRIGVAGTVRNLFDGRVEAIIEGAPQVVEQMLDWLRSGPPTARVEQVQVTEARPTGASGFELR
ncbi:acylphosphatase [Amnibacterium flavum]|uniref:acylphosphatase n=2 Tax=Amnibacterium flavum TaxID=2173173 RepID=A0A2V1HVB0_9MICO|nr:acylphosphatase [Amnibacterium flavum]